MTVKYTFRVPNKKPPSLPTPSLLPPSFPSSLYLILILRTTTAFQCYRRPPAFTALPLQPLGNYEWFVHEKQNKTKKKHKGLQLALTCEEMHTVGKNWESKYKKTKCFVLQETVEVRDSPNSLFGGLVCFPGHSRALRPASRSKSGCCGRGWELGITLVPHPGSC